MQAHDDRHWYELYDGLERLVDEVPRCGHAEFSKGTRQAFGDRRGSDSVSFECYFVIRGVLSLKVAELKIEAAAGHMIFVRPNEAVVGGGPGFAVDPCHVSWMVLRPGTGTARANSPLVKLVGNLSRIEQSTFPVSQDTLHCATRLVAEHRRRDLHSAAAVRALAVLLATGIVRDYERLLDQDNARKNWAATRIASLLERIETTNDYNVSIDEMAVRCKLSHSYFCRIFLRHYGTTPAEYLTRLRIKKARTLLATTNRSVIDIAMQLGFSSSQYFATVFRKYSDLTPSAYRRSIGGQEGKVAP
jgi:AraC-like DNA-binding protein